MAARSERTFRLESAVDHRRQPRRIELDVYSIGGLKGKGLIATLRTLVEQSRDRHRLGRSIPKV